MRLKFACGLAFASALAVGVTGQVLAQAPQPTQVSPPTPYPV